MREIEIEKVEGLGKLTGGSPEIEIEIEIEM